MVSPLSAVTYILIGLGLALLILPFFLIFTELFNFPLGVLSSFAVSTGFSILILYSNSKLKKQVGIPEVM